MADKDRATVVTLCQFFQSSMQEIADRFMNELARKVYVTPTSFLELIKAFKGLLQDKRDDILGAKVSQLISSHLRSGHLSVCQSVSSVSQFSQSLYGKSVSQLVSFMLMETCGRSTGGPI
jgi:hypothetical protein